MLTNVENPTSYPKISVSELNTLLRCTKKHDYAYRQGLVSVAPPTYLTKGSYLHALIERYLTAPFRGEPFDLDEASTQVQAELLEERGTTVLEPDRLEANRSFELWLEEVARLGVDLKDYVAMAPSGELLVEAEFMVDVGWKDLDDKPVLLHGVIDLVGLDDDGGLWPNEHKTASRAWSASDFQLHYQGPLYVTALRTLFPEVPVEGFQYNFFLPKKADIKQVYYTDQHLASVWAEAQAAIHLRDTGSITRQPHWGCNDCWFRTLCITELMGEDASVVRETQFKVDEEKASRFGGGDE